jgi:hypothetical protein
MSQMAVLPGPEVPGRLPVGSRSWGTERSSRGLGSGRDEARQVRGTGTIANPFTGMCAALGGDGTTVVAWKCRPGDASQQWTGYNDGTLWINGKCLDVTSLHAGAKVKAVACTGAAAQAWAIGQVSGNAFGPISNRAAGTVLADPANSTVNGTRLVMEQSRGDLSAPWRVSYHHYVAG